jgi:hemerythrin-like metal-binding protein
VSIDNPTPESYDAIAVESRRLAEEAIHSETARLLIAQAIDCESRAAELRGEPPLAWTDAFCIGHEDLDREHRSLVEAINAVSAAFDANESPTQIRDRLSALKIAITRHLRHESAILEKLKAGTYADAPAWQNTPAFVKAMSEAAIEEHVADHVDSLARIGTIVADATRGSCLDLKSWFVDHAIKHDSHLKSIFQAM